MSPASRKQKRKAPSSVTPSPLGRREHRKRATHDQLLRSGRRWFGQVGLYESRIEDMTRFAGVAKGTLYCYFPSKEALLDAVVQSAFSDLAAHVLPATRCARSSVTRVQAAVDAHFRFYESEPELLRILHQVRGLLKFGRPEGRPLRRHLDAYLDELSRALVVARRDRRHALELARLVFGTASGVASTYASLVLPMPSGRESAALGKGLATLLSRSVARDA